MRCRYRAIRYYGKERRIPRPISGKTGEGSCAAPFPRFAGYRARDTPLLTVVSNCSISASHLIISVYLIFLTISVMITYRAEIKIYYINRKI